MCEKGLEEGEREPSNSSIEEVNHVHNVASLQLVLVVLLVFYFSKDANTS